MNSLYSYEDRASLDDMSQPLPHYFINSSHNTYAENHQLFGNSSVDMYNYAINEGCKLFELDCYDGEEEPKITHGKTLMTNIPISKVFEALASNAFKFSPYPVILSIENHMSEEMQIKMKELAKRILKKIYVPDENTKESNYPSPEALKEHFILKMGRSRIHGTQTIEDDDEDEPKDKVEKLKNTSTEIYDIIGLISVKLNLKEEIQYYPWEIGNITEKKSYKLVVDPPKITALAKINQAFFTKVYPHGFRFGSSNFDPVPAWSMGCQVVALNIQTHDDFCLMNRALFEKSRNVGFVLKPKRLLKSSDFDELYPQIGKFRLRIELISGLFLSHLLEDTNMVKMQFTFTIKGNKNDTLNKPYKTEAFSDNFLNKKLSDSFEFDIFDGDLSFLLVEAKAGSVLAGRACIPVSSMKFGIRSVNFLNNTFKPINESTLLLKVTKTNI